MLKTFMWTLNLPDLEFKRLFIIIIIIFSLYLFIYLFIFFSSFIVFYT